MSNILIIGAGQLGSRHLQGVLLSQNELQITVVDPSNSSLETAQTRAGEVDRVNPNTKVDYCTVIPNGENFEVCIIATSAAVRGDVTKALLKDNKVRHIVFEKVLFQTVDEYEEVSLLLQENETMGWVNCPRRLFPSYNNLKKTLDLREPVNMKVNGSNWGLACNTVHFLDIFSYLVESSSLNLSDHNLHPAIVSSKRSGYYEMTGKLVFNIHEHTLSVECSEEELVCLNISLDNGTTKYTIDEISGSWVEATKDKTKIYNYQPIYQSQLTGVIIDQLLEDNKCGLTTFSDSRNLHIPLIEGFLEHLSLVLKKKIITCPIT